MPKQQLTPELEETLQELFFDDVLQGLANPKQLQSYSKAKNIQITQAVANEFIEKQGSAQRFTRLKKQNLFIPITAPAWTYQIDTLKLSGKSVIVLIEITSRKVYSAVVKDATAAEAAKAMEAMIQKIKAEGNDIKKIESDSGTEFYGQFDKLLKTHNIEHYRYPSTDSANTALSKVERVNGTLRSFYEQRKAQPNNHLKTPAQLVPQITNFYNNREHSATHKSPNEFEEQDFAPQRIKELKRGLDPTRKVLNRYPIGSKVRIAEQTTIFTKGSKPRWSKEVYIITKREGYSFYVDDLPKPFRAWELLPTAETPKQLLHEIEEEQEAAEEIPEPEPAIKQREKRKIKETKPFEAEEKQVKKRQPKEYIVESIIRHRSKKGKLYLLTKYKDSDKLTYQPIENFYTFKSGKRIVDKIAEAYLQSKRLVI